MEIRFAGPRDIPGIIDLLQQVGEVHHRICSAAVPRNMTKQHCWNCLQIPTVPFWRPL